MYHYTHLVHIKTCRRCFAQNSWGLIFRSLLYITVADISLTVTPIVKLLLALRFGFLFYLKDGLIGLALSIMDALLDLFLLDEHLTLSLLVDGILLQILFTSFQVDNGLLLHLKFPLHLTQ